MQISDSTDPNSGMEFFLSHPGREVDVAHYFRQTAITRRRHEPWLNRVWCQNRQLSMKVFTWKL